MRVIRLMRGLRDEVIKDTKILFYQILNESARRAYIEEIGNEVVIPSSTIDPLSTSEIEIPTTTTKILEDKIILDTSKSKQEEMNIMIRGVI